MTDARYKSWPLTLGEFIEELKECSLGDQVVFGPGYVGPVLEFDSYRGYYDHIALAHGVYAKDHNPGLRPRQVPEITVGEYLEFLRSIPGQTREGWKGGLYRYDLSTPVWIALRGEVGMAVLGVNNCGTGNVSVLSAQL